MSSCKVLVVDDERPALDELAFLLAARRRASARCSPATPRPRRCGSCRRARSTRSSSTSRCRASPASSWPRCSAASARRRRSSSSPPTRSTRSRPSSCSAVDYVLKPVRADRLAEAVRRRRCVERRGERGEPARDDAADPGRARRRHPLRQPLATSPTSRRRATTPGCTPPTDSHLVRTPLDDPRGGVGRRRASCGSTARCWSRWPTSPRCAWRAAAARSWSASRPRRARSSAAATPASCASCCWPHRTAGP